MFCAKVKNQGKKFDINYFRENNSLDCYGRPLAAKISLAGPYVHLNSYSWTIGPAKDCKSKDTWLTYLGDLTMNHTIVC